MHDRKATLTTDPSVVFTSHSAIREDGGSVELHAPAELRAGKRDLLRVEIVKGGRADDVFRGVSEDVSDRLGGIQDTGMLGQVCIAYRISMSSSPDALGRVLFGKSSLP